MSHPSSLCFCSHPVLYNSPRQRGEASSEVTDVLVLVLILQQINLALADSSHFRFTFSNINALFLTELTTYKIKKNLIKLQNGFLSFSPYSEATLTHIFGKWTKERVKHCIRAYYTFHIKKIYDF